MQECKSPVLDALYAIAAIDVNTDRIRKDVESLQSRQKQIAVSSSNDDDGGQERILLSQRNGKLFADVLEVPELEAELGRAVWQVDKTLRAEKELQEEKSEIESATRQPTTASRVQ